jgi:Spy/CpxP family protein refolding chaperone
MKLTGRTTLSALATTVVLSLVGCAQQTGPTDQVPEQSGETQQKIEPKADQARPAKKAERGPRAGGPGMLLRAALDQLELRADQKTTIEGLLKDIDGKPGFESGARQDFEKALAASVRDGSVATADFSANFAAIEKEATERSSSFHAALNKLHDTLDASQRATLVANLKQHMEKGSAGWGHGPMHRGDPGECDGPRGKGDPSAAGDQPSDSNERAARPMRRGGGQFGRHGGRGAGPGFGLVRGLDLTEEQQTKLRALRDEAKPERTDFGAMKGQFRERGTKMLDAFASDSFDAAKLMGDNDPSTQARGRAEQQVKHIRDLAAVLTADQRGKLADNLQRGPQKRR